VIALLTTSRKATAGGLTSFLSALYVLVQSGQPISWRDLFSCLIVGALGFLAVWAPSNTEPYEPRHQAVDG